MLAFLLAQLVVVALGTSEVAGTIPGAGERWPSIPLTWARLCLFAFLHENVHTHTHTPHTHTHSHMVVHFKSG